MLTSPGSCNANSLCHFQRSKMVLFNCGPSHHTQGCLRIAALVSLSYALQVVWWLEEADSELELNINRLIIHREWQYQKRRILREMDRSLTKSFTLGSRCLHCLIVFYLEIGGVRSQTCMRAPKENYGLFGFCVLFFLFCFVFFKESQLLKCLLTVVSKLRILFSVSTMYLWREVKISSTATHLHELWTRILRFHNPTFFEGGGVYVRMHNCSSLLFLTHLFCLFNSLCPGSLIYRPRFQKLQFAALFNTHFPALALQQVKNHS